MRSPYSAQPRPRRDAGNGAHGDTGILAHAVEGVEPLAVSGPEAARLVGVSSRHWARLDARGLAPAGVRLGRRRVWTLEELRAWLAAGCPSRDSWDALREARGGRP